MFMSMFQQEVPVAHTVPTEVLLANTRAMSVLLKETADIYDYIRRCFRVILNMELINKKRLSNKIDFDLKNVVKFRYIIEPNCTVIKINMIGLPEPLSISLSSIKELIEENLTDGFDLYWTDAKQVKLIRYYKKAKQGASV